MNNSISPLQIVYVRGCRGALLESVTLYDYCRTHNPLN